MTKYSESPFWDAIKQPKKTETKAANPKITGLTDQTIQKILDKEIQGVTVKRNSTMLASAFNPFYPMPEELRNIYPQDLVKYFDNMVSKAEKGFLHD